MTSKEHIEVLNFLLRSASRDRETARELDAWIERAGRKDLARLYREARARWLRGLAEEAKKRQGARTDLKGHVPSSEDKRRPEVQARDQAAALVGVSGKWF